MERKSLKELEKLLLSKKDTLKNQVSLFDNNENTQVKELLIKTNSELDLIECILTYIKTGSKILLK